MEKTFDNKLKDDNKLEKFKSILEEKSRKLKNDFLFRDISKKWDYNEKETTVLKYFVNLSLKDMKTIEEIHQEWRVYNKEIDEKIRKTLLEVFKVFNDEELLNKKDKQILCYFYFLIVNYAFGYVYLNEENDKKENHGHVKIEKKGQDNNNKTFIEISVEIVIRKLMNIFNALKDEDFNDKKKAGIFFALIVMFDGTHLCAQRIDYMTYINIGVFPNGNYSKEECSLIFNEDNIIFFSSTSANFSFDSDHAIKFNISKHLENVKTKSEQMMEL
nr:15169_t:CDS:2 [Entrophospora candida]